MVPYGVAFPDHLPDQVRACVQIIAHHEEGGRGAVLFQGFQDPGGVSVFISAVKGEIQDFFFGIFPIIGVVGFQLLTGGVPCRGRALLLKA